MNGILSKARFNSLRIILDSGYSSYIILGKNMKKKEIRIPRSSIGIYKGMTSTLTI